MAKSGECKTSVFVLAVRIDERIFFIPYPPRLAACAQGPALHIEVGLYEPCACRSNQLSELLIDTVVLKPVKCCGICDPIIVHHRSLGMCKANGSSALVSSATDFHAGYSIDII